MKSTNLQATSDNSWLEAARLLITAAQQSKKDLRCLTIKEDLNARSGKYKLTTNLSDV